MNRKHWYDVPACDKHVHLYSSWNKHPVLELRRSLEVSTLKCRKGNFDSFSVCWSCLIFSAAKFFAMCHLLVVIKFYTGLFQTPTFPLRIQWAQIKNYIFSQSIYIVPYEFRQSLRFAFCHFVWCKQTLYHRKTACYVVSWHFQQLRAHWWCHYK